MDIVDTATRSRMMAAIRGRNTRPELTLRRALHRRGFRFRLHARSLPGRPDMVLPRWGVAIQIHGCFWHRHRRCPFATMPATRHEFWQGKFAANTSRDKRNLDALHQAEWRVAIIWECGLRSGDSDSLVDELENWIRVQQDTLLELPR